MCGAYLSRAVYKKSNNAYFTACLFFALASAALGALLLFEKANVYLSLAFIVVVTTCMYAVNFIFYQYLAARFQEIRLYRHRVGNSQFGGVSRHGAFLFLPRRRIGKNRLDGRTRPVAGHCLARRRNFDRDIRYESKKQTRKRLLNFLVKTAFFFVAKR